MQNFENKHGEGNKLTEVILGGKEIANEGGMKRQGGGGFIIFY